MKTTRYEPREDGKEEVREPYTILHFLKHHEGTMQVQLTDCGSK